MQNDPSLWKTLLPRPGADSHKYTRGHAIILGGSRMTGAARLASEASMRMGAGMCSIVAERNVAHIYQAAAPHVLFEPLTALADFAEHLRDERRHAALIGPGAGHDDPEALRQAVIGLLATRKPVVIDADALTVFAEQRDVLFAALHAKAVLTPHEGEFARLFDKVQPETRPAQACEAAKKSGAVIVLKGAETLIAHPEGRLICSTHASPYLATAGAGDVLGGMILGLVTQGMAPFDAACATVWIHGDAGLRIGPGLVAPDIIQILPEVLRSLL